MAASNNEVWQTAVVTAVRDVAPDIRRIELAPAQPKRAEPGSHIDLNVQINGEPAKRSYSIVDSSVDGARLVISVLKAPASRGGSVYMHTVKPGDSLEITQPLQNFPMRVGAERYVLLAGGIGIAAVMKMAEVLKHVKADYRLIYVGRSRQVMAYLAELEAEHGARLQVHADDEMGRLDVKALIAGVSLDTELYMCGPIRLMDAVRRSWVERELSVPNLRYETFGNSGWYNPEEFWVRIPRLGVEVKVGQDRSMLEALEDEGVDMMFDCRKGECGLCEVRILDLVGTVDHRDVFYSQNQQRAAAKMCCCVSRAVTANTGSRGDTDLYRRPAVVTIDVP
ncbi:PDR/VanB family oxidoreductase [Paenarthrobacter ureafaciens]|uniref:PDR/VanB family oxidoreductase n=1 Tax=Paenarthrobacter ureafaciens TaxID=37931 RepID=UPI002DB55DC8|nr:PDR/VanB family oxidoreductase [Paenarthrobacter ureafaciens]MEC3853906.1 PDR/VanB family oxidoreductase [Paenarthrobacter ureafaciens]